MISRDDYIEFHENPDSDREFIPTEECVCCLSRLPKDEMINIEGDYLCEECAEDVDIKEGKEGLIA